jgi:putative MATE family efflux protein
MRLTMERNAPALKLDHPPAADPESWGSLLRQLLLLAVPVCAEHSLHILVGWTSTWVGNHLHRYAAETDLSRAEEVAAGAAVGTMTYILWLVSLLISAVAVGSTAIIARAIGARHRRLANSITGQSISAALIVGVIAGALMFLYAGAIADFSGLESHARDFAYRYLRVLAVAMPFTMVMFTANACLRGAGDTVSPAITMIVVDVINIGFTCVLTYGWLGLPAVGFAGIAWGTSIAYISGGVIQFVLLTTGRGGIRLYLHRMRPHWHNLRRLLRIGLPGGMNDILFWAANFGVMRFVNQLGTAEGNAHNITIRIESLSYMMGFAVATAVATMVGQSLGMGRPIRAQRSAYVGYALGGGIMTFAGIVFIVLHRWLATLLSDDPRTQQLASTCLLITGFIQCGFAAAMIFNSALRGAGDTFAAMVLNTASVFAVRLFGVYVAVKWLNLGLAAVWIVLGGEMMLRGGMMYARFLHGGWKKISV